MFTRVARVMESRTFRVSAALVLLAALYWAADWRQVFAVLASLEGLSLTAALLLFIPQTLVSAWRWQALVSPARMSLWESTRQTLIASAANLVVLSKLGDFVKAGMIPRSSEAWLVGPRLVLYEKAADVAALLFCLLCGCLVASSWGLTAAVAAFFACSLAARNGALRETNDPTVRYGRLAADSILLWSLHLLQIGLFLRAAGVAADWPQVAARVPLAIFAGLAPITLWGIGTRDAALVALFADIAPASTIAAAGLLTALRYLVPGAAGVCLIGLPGIAIPRRVPKAN